MANSKRNKIIKTSLLGLLVVFLVIQFIHPAKNVSAQANPQDIGALYPVPDSVKLVLQKACMDCHSNNTRYPWYNNIQPVAWWMNDHVTEGKRELNFSEFGVRTPEKQAKKLRKMAKEVQEGEMPLSSYTWIHKEAKLSEQEKNLLIGWANSLADKIYPKTTM